MKKKIITVITGSRPDYAALKQVLKLINLKKNLILRLVVTGSHLFSGNKNLLKFIFKDGFKIHKKIIISKKQFTPDAISTSMGLAVKNFSNYYKKNRPDLILVMGDRFEIFASVVAAMPFNIPIGHIEGGEITQGAFDDAIRHSLTKLSHLHFVSNMIHKRRVEQLGEELWRINLTGSPCIDTIKHNKTRTLKFLQTKYNFKINKKLFIITFHPVTLEYKNTKIYIYELLKALKRFNYTMIFTAPNQDTNSHIILREIKKFIKTSNNAYFVNNFGSRDYLSILKYASVLVGNSSSGIIEAPSFKLPAVNIGNREAGRLRAKNVIDVSCNSRSIIKGINKAVSINFKKKLKNLKNPYGDGKASERIINYIKKIDLRKSSIINKKFLDNKFK